MKVLEFKAVLKSWAVTMKDILVFTLSLQNFTLVYIYQHFSANQNSGAEPSFGRGRNREEPVQDYVGWIILILRFFRSIFLYSLPY